MELFRRLIAILVLPVLIGAAVTACASRGESSVAPGGGRGELVTESDETAERKRARIRIELALGYFEQGKTTIALDELKQAIAADPLFSDAYSLRGLIYMRLNDFTIAEDSFNKAMALNPKNADVLHNLGWLKCQQQAFPLAFDLFSRALSDPLYGERAKTFRALGLCQERAGMLKEAESSLLRSYEFDAGNPVTGYNLANILFKKGSSCGPSFISAVSTTVIWPTLSHFGWVSRSKSDWPIRMRSRSCRPNCNGDSPSHLNLTGCDEVRSMNDNSVMVMQGSSPSPSLTPPSSGSGGAGALLRAAREAQGLHIAALAVSLKVPVRKLEALEADRFDLLPDVVFVRALTLSVCRSLKLDPKPVMSALPQRQPPQIKTDYDGLNTTFEAPGRFAGFSWRQVANPVGLSIIALLIVIVAIAFWPTQPNDSDRRAQAQLPLTRQSRVLN